MAKWPYTTQRWQKLRRQKLQVNPLCEACLQLGYIEPASAVDHRIRVSAGGDPFPALDQLASLCTRCHNTKTRAEQTGVTDWMTRGCDIHGMPLDPKHPWYRAR